MIDKIAMLEAIENRLVKMVKHPYHDLYLLSYTKSAVAGHVWTPETLAARSLVVDADFNIVSPCIPKFFNDFDQVPEMKKMNFQVYEKLDGSLISAFLYKGELILRSKGVWQSDLINQVQSWAGANMLRRSLHEGITYVCEWIHPMNRHIVDYGTRVDLVLLAGLEHDLGVQYHPEMVYWEHGRAKNLTREYKAGRDLNKIRGSIPEGEEGYVLWSTRNGENLRTKIKSAEYLQLHRVKFNLNPKAMLDLIKEGDPEKIQRMKDTIINLDEQSANMIQSMYDEMVTSINDFRWTIQSVYHGYKDIQDRKDFAQAVFQHGQAVAGGCFILRDGRELGDYIYRAVDLNAYNRKLEEGYSIEQDRPA